MRLFGIGEIGDVAPVIRRLLSRRVLFCEFFCEPVPVTARWSKNENIVSVAFNLYSEAYRVDGALLTEVPGSRRKLIA